MKTIMLLAVLAIAGLGVLHVFSPPEVRAQTAEEANAALSKAEKDIHDAAVTTTNRAIRVQDHLDAPDRKQALPKELQDFFTTTQRLQSLRGELTSAITTYEAAQAEKLAAFDNERGAITDPVVRRSMDVLRRHTARDIGDRLAAARTTVTSLDQVLAQGADLQHAAQCVLIAADLGVTGEDIDAQIRQARQQATAYAQLTSTMLGRITSALAD